MSKFSFIILTCALAAASQAASLTINFDAANKITGDNGVVGNGSGIVAQLVLTDAGVNTVTGTLTNLSPTTGGLGEDQTIGYTRLFAFTAPGGSPTVTSASSMFDGAHSGWDLGGITDASITYNLDIQFKQGGNKVGAGDSVAFTLTGTGLDVSDFKSLLGDVRANVHVQSLDGGGSVKLYGVEAVPEPTTMAALGLGAAAMLRRRKKA